MRSLNGCKGANLSICGERVKTDRRDTVMLFVCIVPDANNDDVGMDHFFGSVDDIIMG